MLIAHSYGAPCLPSRMTKHEQSPEPDVEDPVTPQWAADVRRTREERGVTQMALADAVDASQNAIAKIEACQVAQSRFVKPISVYLGLPVPQRYADEDDRRWAEMGRKLRAQSPATYDAACAFVLSMLGDAEKKTREH